MNYHEQYLKYKQKYLDKKKLIGGIPYNNVKFIGKWDNNNWYKNIKGEDEFTGTFIGDFIHNGKIIEKNKKFTGTWTLNNLNNLDITDNELKQFIHNGSDNGYILKIYMDKIYDIINIEKKYERVTDNTYKINNDNREFEIINIEDTSDYLNNLRKICENKIIRAFFKYDGTDKQIEYEWWISNTDIQLWNTKDSKYIFEGNIQNNLYSPHTKILELIKKINYYFFDKKNNYNADEKNILEALNILMVSNNNPIESIKLFYEHLKKNEINYFRLDLIDIDVFKYYYNYCIDNKYNKYNNYIDLNDNQVKSEVLDARTSFIENIEIGKYIICKTFSGNRYIINISRVNTEPIIQNTYRQIFKYNLILLNIPNSCYSTSNKKIKNNVYSNLYVGEIIHRIDIDPYIFCITDKNNLFIVHKSQDF